MIRACIISCWLWVGTFGTSVCAQQSLQVHVVGASSYMSTAKMNYIPEHTIDGDLQTWWTPAAPNANGSNSWLEFQFPSEGKQYVVTAIEIHPGSHYPNYPGYGDLFKKNLRLLQAKLEFADGSSEEIYLKDEDRVQRIELKEAHQSNWVKLIPKAVFTAEKWNDLCISHVGFWGYISSGETASSVEGEMPLDNLLGAYLKTDMPCGSPRMVVYVSENGGYEYLDVGLMDAWGGVIKYAYLSDASSEGSIRVGVLYPGAEEVEDTDLFNGYINITSQEDRLRVRTGEISINNLLDSQNEYLYQNYLAGTYRTSTGETFMLYPDFSFYRQGTTGSLSFYFPSMASNCGELVLEIEGASKLNLGISYTEDGINLYEIECEEEGPDCWLKDEPYLILTRER